MDRTSLLNANVFKCQRQLFSKVFDHNSVAQSHYKHTHISHFVTKMAPFISYVMDKSINRPAFH